MKNTVWRWKKAERRFAVNYNVYNFKISEILKYCFIGAMIGILICWLCYDSVYSFPAAVVICAFFIISKKKELIKKRQDVLLFHFKEFLIVLQSLLSSGYSFENSIKAAYKEMEKQAGKKADIVNEIQIMINGLKLNKSAELLFEQLADRSGLDDIKLFSQMLNISKKHGGRIKELIVNTKRIICEKIETKQEIDKILAAKRTEQMIMSVTPAAVILYLRLTFNGFIEKLYGNAAGVCIMTICLAVYAAAFFIGKKIVSIEV